MSAAQQIITPENSGELVTPDGKPINKKLQAPAQPRAVKLMLGRDEVMQALVAYIQARYQVPTENITVAFDHHVDPQGRYQGCSIGVKEKESEDGKSGSTETDS